LEISKPSFGWIETVGLGKKTKCFRVPKNAGNILPSSGFFPVKLLLTWLLVSLLLQGKSKLATGNSVPSSQRAIKISNERKPLQRNDENVICPPTKAEHFKDFRSRSWKPVVGIDVQFNITCVDDFYCCTVHF
jgi:hypothetical protein